MTLKKQTGRAVLIASLLGSTAAYADVTAEQVWADWQSGMVVYDNASLSVGSEDYSGGVLTAADVTLTFEDEESTVTADLGTMTFTEQGDGTVSVDMPDVTTVSVALTPTFGSDVTLNISVTQEGDSLIVSGTPEEMTYDLTAARYVIALDGAEGDTEDMILNDVQMTMSDIDGAYTSSMADGLRNIDYALSSGAINMIVDIAEDGGPGSLNFMGTIDGLTSQAVVSVPAEIDMEAPETAFVEGLAIDAGYSFGASNYAFTFSENNTTTEGSASADGGEMSIMMDQDGFSYSGGATAPSVAISGGEVPFPIEVSMAEYGYGLTLPLAASEEPETFGLQLLLSELTVNDMVWSMVDPQGMLDHGPATVSVDIDGTAALDYDVTDPSQMPQMMMADTPGDLNSLNINDLTVRLAGAEIVGSGAFTFDNSDLDTFGGVPRPEGTAQATLTGVNGLIDTLVEMGLVPQEQVMGARMMMGMFLQTVGDDVMESRLEVNEEGQIFVNGQRLR